MLRTKNLQTYDFDGMDPLSELLVLGGWAICSTQHTSFQVTPGQLVFGRDMLMKVRLITDWKAIRPNKQNNVDRNNIKKNK